MKISLIIPTKNREEILKECLKSIKASYSNIVGQIIIVNDGNTLIDVKNTQLTSIYENKKTGVASARNLGSSVARHEVLMFLDDDMIVVPGVFEEVIRFHKINKNAVLNFDWIYPENLIQKALSNGFGRYLITNGFTSLKGLLNDPEDWNDSTYRTMQGITSQNLSIQKILFDKLNGYDEKMPFAGFEDSIFSKNLKEGSIRMLLNTNLKMYHNEVDRVTIDTWLDRKVRGSISRRIAVENGFPEFQLHYNFVKRQILNLLISIKSLIIGLTKISMKFKLLDSITYWCVNLLLATAIYEGYEKKR